MITLPQIHPSQSHKESGASRKTVSQRGAHRHSADATPRQISPTRPMRRSDSESALFQGPDILKSRTSSLSRSEASLRPASQLTDLSPCETLSSRSESVRYLGPGIFKSNTTSRQWSRSEASLGPATELTEPSVKKSPRHRTPAKPQAAISRTGSRHGVSPRRSRSHIVDLEDLGLCMSIK